MESMMHRQWKLVILLLLWESMPSFFHQRLDKCGISCHEFNSSTEVAKEAGAPFETLLFIYHHLIIYSNFKSSFNYLIEQQLFLDLHNWIRPSRCWQFEESYSVSYASTCQLLSPFHLVFMSTKCRLECIQLSLQSLQMYSWVCSYRLVLTSKFVFQLQMVLLIALM